MEMRWKALRYLWIAGFALMFTVAVGTMVASNRAEAELPKCVGSKACLGCHVTMYDRWDDSGHAHMTVQVMRPTDLPGDMNLASPELKAELMKADWIIAGQRFLARDPATGDMSFLNVQWDAAKKEYVKYTGGTNWTKNCAGCHTTGFEVKTATWAEPGIGCEMCHGPGRDHILAKGDPNKIHASTDSLVCGQCHNGGQMPDGTRWPVGFVPGMKLEDVGFTLMQVDPTKPPPSAAQRYRQYPQWLASAHANAVKSLEATSYAQGRCYACHSTEVFDLARTGAAYDPKAHKVYDGVSCVACHRGHSLALRMEPQQLCTTCHNGGIQPGQTAKPGSTVHHPMKEMLEGYGAIGIPETKGAHSTIRCIDCHMTDGNHLMHILKPADVAGTNRKDTCSSCHTTRSTQSRDLYLGLWQESVQMRLDQIKANVDKVDAALKNSPNLLGNDLKNRYLAAKTNYTFVHADGSRGAHNFDYALTILQDSLKVTTEAAKKVQ